MASNYTSKPVSLSGATLIEILPYNKGRTALVLFNQGSDSCFVGFKPSAMIEIPSGNGINFGKECPINKVYANCAIAQTATLIVWEG